MAAPKGSKYGRGASTIQFQSNITTGLLFGGQGNMKAQKEVEAFSLGKSMNDDLVFNVLGKPLRQYVHLLPHPQFKQAISRTITD